MRKFAVLASVFLGIVLGLLVFYFFFQKSSLLIPLSKKTAEVLEKPLEKYSFDRLRERKFEASAITLGKVTKDDPKFSSRMFYYTVDGKKVSGLMNLPKTPGTYPVIVLFHGFVPKAIYTPGEGGRRTAEYFATHGYITLAPDFLGFGESDQSSKDGMEERFQTYTTALGLLSSIKSLKTSLAVVESGAVQADTEKVGIWGHSNGGHIALSVLSITGKPYPTVLWNPVSKMFPYSILYFTDEYDDHGKWLIQLVANFEKEYDAEKYSPPNYYSYIEAPIQLNQAADDEEVPLRWSNQLNETLLKLGKDVTYYTYPLENHNFNNGSWSVAVSRAVDFYTQEFNK